MISAARFFGMIDPVLSLKGGACLVGEMFPTTCSGHRPRRIIEGTGFRRSRFLAVAARSRDSGYPGFKRRVAEETGELAMHTRPNIVHLGAKELRSLGCDNLMPVRILFAFTGQVYLTATGVPEPLHKASIVILDEDRSQLSMRIVNVFLSV